MKYTQLCGIDKPVSRLIYGTNAYMAADDTERAVEALDLAWANGFTAFDTAHTYAHSEKNIGIWMQRRGLRHKVVLLDKGCNPGQSGITEVMSAQLLYDQTAESCKRLQTDYLDMYVLHRDDPSYPVEPIIDTLNDLKSRGVINKFGASNWTFARICMANKYASEHGMEGFTVVSPSFNIAETAADPWGGSVTLCGQQNEAARQWYAQHNIAVMPYSALGRGFFSGKYKTHYPLDIQEYLPYAPIAEYDTPQNRRRLAAAEQIARERNAAVSQVCLAYLLQLPMDVYPIINPSTQEHILENLGSLDLQLTDEEIRRLLCD